MNKKKKIKLLTVILTFISFGQLFINPVKAAPVTVSQKTKAVTQTKTFNIHTNPNILTPRNSTFNTDFYSFLDGKVFSTGFEGGQFKNDLTNNVLAFEGGAYIDNTGSHRGASSLHGNDKYLLTYTNDEDIPNKLDSITYGFEYDWDGKSGIEIACIHGVQLFITRDAIGFNTGNSDVYGCKNIIEPYHWYYITVTIGKGNIKSGQIYIDGVKQSMSELGSTVHNNSMILANGRNDLELLGSAYSNNQYCGNTYMDDLTIWNRKLSDKEVSNLVSCEVYNNKFRSNGWGYAQDAFFGSTLTRGMENSESYISTTGNAQFIQYTAAYHITGNWTYTVSAYVRAHGSSNSPPSISIYDTVNTGTLKAKGVSEAGYNQGWKKIYVTATADANAVLYFILNSAGGTKTDFKNIKIEEGTQSTPDISYGKEVNCNILDIPELKNTYGISDTLDYSETGYLQSQLKASSINVKPVPTSITSHTGDVTKLSQSFTDKKTLTNVPTNSNSQFASSIPIDKDGYKGSMPLTSVDWTTNWVKNRYSSIQTSSLISDWYESLSQWNYPSSVAASSYDSLTKQTITGNIPLKATPNSISSANTTFYSKSSGLVENRHEYNQWITWMSNNPYTYFGGAYSYGWSLPRPFKDYYGPAADTGTWYLVDYHWGDNRPHSAAEEGESSWISDGNYGGVHANSWARGVYLKYARTAQVNKYQANYSGQIHLPDYISSYNGIANYAVTLTQEQASANYDTCTDWVVTVSYKGELQAVDNPPVAQFTCNDKVHVGENLNIVENSTDPDPWDSIVSKDWYTKPYVNKFDKYLSSNYDKVDRNSLNSFTSTGRYSILLEVKDQGNPPYSGPLSATSWNNVKVYPINNEPIAMFTVNKFVKPGENLFYHDFSNPNNTIMGYDGSITDHITEWHYQWKRDKDENWIDGRPSNFDNEGVYNIRLQVRDNGNFIPSIDMNDDSFDDRLYSKWSVVQKVVVKSNTNPVNIHAQSIKVLDSSNSEVSTLFYGQSYRIKFSFSNDSDYDITDPFDINFGLDSSEEDIWYNAVLKAHCKPVEVVSKPFTCLTDSKVISLDAYADYQNLVEETNEDDNALSVNVKVNKLNLTASNIKILNQDGTIADTSNLLQNCIYKAQITFSNTGRDDVLNTFNVSLNEKNNGQTGIGNDLCEAIVLGGCKVNETKVVEIPFVPRNRGSMLYTGFVDCKNEVYETDETDNMVSTLPIIVKRTNIKAVNMQIVDINGNVYVDTNGAIKQPIIQGCQYIAKVNLLNDGDTDIREFNVGLFRNNLDNPDSKVKVSLLPNDNKNHIVDIPFVAYDRGSQILYTAYADCDNNVLESDETDNKVMENVNAIYINLKAESIEIVGENDDAIVNEMYKGTSYRAKVKYSNTGDIDVNNFSIALQEDNKEIRITNVSNIKKLSNQIIYIPFKPTASGAKMYTAFIDSKNEIKENNENDNTISIKKNVGDYNLINFRISNIVNPPIPYLFPIYTKDMPAQAKSGYKVEFDIDSIGVPDNVKLEIKINGNSQGNFPMIKTYQDTNKQIWHYEYIIPIDTTEGSIISCQIKGYKSTSILDYNKNNNWNGDAIKIIGNAYEDILIQRCY